MDDTRDIVEEMRQREKRGWRRFMFNNTPNVQPKKDMLFKEEDLLDEIWFDLWKVL